MKFDLVVERPRRMAGTAIPITGSEFVIGRDARCQLRPASATVSKKHCAVLVRGDQAFIHDFDSTNGTFLNGERVEGERELRDGDQLKIAGIEFRIALNVASAIARPAGEPGSSPSADEDAAAALLLSLEESGAAPGSVNVDSEGIPTGSTVLLAPDAAKPERAQPQGQAPSGAAARDAAARQAQGDTSSAAQDILKRYRRPHS